MLDAPLPHTFKIDTIQVCITSHCRGFSALTLLLSHVLSDIIMGSIPNSTLTHIDVFAMDKHGPADSSILWVNVVFLVVIIVTSALRFYVRLRMVKFAGWDDR